MDRNASGSIVDEPEWESKKDPDIKQSSVRINAPARKSSVKLEEKFKRYVSEADVLMRTLSFVPDDDVSIFENLCDSTHLLEKNTESFRCLTQLLLSSSSLAKNRLFLFPPLEDPGIDFAFHFEESPPENDDTGVEKYKKLCTEMEIVPISRIIASLHEDTINLKYYGLTSKQIRALTVAMKANTRVQTLILEDNWLNPEMVQMVSDMVVENTSLQHLSLQECRIGEEGAQKLGEVLSSFQTLKSLDLSFNDLGDNGLLALRDGFCENPCLKKLNISHNNLTEDSAEAMEKILLENKYIEELDLSWNGFFTAQGNRRLFSGFMNSDRIKILNLAWNGLGIAPAVRPLTRYLRKSECLEELDLSNNRLVGASLTMTRAAINKNHSLRILKIGNNIYPPDQAHFLLTMLAGKSKDPLFYMDMENMYIKKESKPVLNKIANIGKLIKIGGILGNYEIHGPDPKKLIYERCRYILMKPKKVKARKDFGHFILSLPDHPISPEDFQKELKKMKMKKLDKDLVQAAMNLFMNKKKQVECQELMQDYMSYYPETKLPPPKPKKGKKGKKGDKKDIAADEKIIQVHDLESAPVVREGAPLDQPRQSKFEGRQSVIQPKEDLSIKDDIATEPTVEEVQTTKSVTDETPLPPGETDETPLPPAETDETPVPADETEGEQPEANIVQEEPPANAETTVETNVETTEESN